MDTPEGLVVDRTGAPMTDSAKILEALVKGNAALLPLGGSGEDTGGYKGYGYAAAVEILSSALQAGNFMKALTGFSNGARAPIELGHFFIAVNIEAFIELDSFRKTTGDILRAIRESEKAAGAEKIYTAGEKEYEAWLERGEKGIPLSDSVIDDMRVMRDELGLADYSTFIWEE